MLPIVGALVIVSVGTAKTIVSDELTALLPKTVAEPITYSLLRRNIKKIIVLWSFWILIVQILILSLVILMKWAEDFCLKTKVSSADELLVG